MSVEKVSRTACIPVLHKVKEFHQDILYLQVFGIRHFFQSFRNGLGKCYTVMSVWPHTLHFDTQTVSEAFVMLMNDSCNSHRQQNGLKLSQTNPSRCQTVGPIFNLKASPDRYICSERKHIKLVCLWTEKCHLNHKFTVCWPSSFLPEIIMRSCVLHLLTLLKSKPFKLWQSPSQVMFSRGRAVICASLKQLW